VTDSDAPAPDIFSAFNRPRSVGDLGFAGLAWNRESAPRSRSPHPMFIAHDGEEFERPSCFIRTPVECFPRHRKTEEQTEKCRHSGRHDGGDSEQEVINRWANESQVEGVKARKAEEERQKPDRGPHTADLRQSEFWFRGSLPRRPASLQRAGRDCIYASITDINLLLPATYIAVCDSGRGTFVTPESFGSWFAVSLSKVPRPVRLRTPHRGQRTKDRTQNPGRGTRNDRNTEPEDARGYGGEGGIRTISQIEMSNSRRKHGQ
jgi:hypothetical protein